MCLPLPLTPSAGGPEAGVADDNAWGPPEVRLQIFFLVYNRRYDRLCVYIYRVNRAVAAVKKRECLQAAGVDRMSYRHRPTRGPPR